MGKGGGKIEITRYYLSQHQGICVGPVTLKEVFVKEKSIWQGEADTLEAIVINDPELFGGDKKEGGVGGTVWYLPGADDQIMPDDLAQKLGRADGLDCPGFRGLASLFFVGTGGITLSSENAIKAALFNAAMGGAQPGFYWAANAPYLPSVWATVGRAPAAPVVFDGWYAKAVVTLVNPTVSMLGTNGFYVDPSGGAQLIDKSDTVPWGVTNSEFPAGIPKRIYSDSNNTVTFYWCTENVMDAEEIDLRLQFPSASVGPDMRASFTWQFWNQDASSPSPITSTVISPGTPSQSSGNPFDVRSLWPDNWFFAVDGDGTPSSGFTSEFINEDANPAYIIYECLTNTDWGMGAPDTALDVASFADAAGTLVVEEFGLSMLWTRQASIQDFVQEILDHIQAVLFVDPSTGLLTLKLIRDDYDPDTLDVLTPDNAQLSSFARKLWGDIVNEITVTWTNPENEQEETITIQDDASIAIQGGIVSDSRNYYGVRNADLAKALAVRDLRSAGQPLASCEAEVDRTQWQLRPASVVKLTWPEYGLDELVMRVSSIDYGKAGDPTIKLSLFEDVYGLDIGSYDAPPSTAWVDPSSPPAPIETVQIFTLPYFFTLNAGVDLADAEYPEVLAGVLATTDNSDTYAIEVWDELTSPSGSTGWQSISSNNVIGYGELAAELPAAVSSASVSFTNVIGQTSPTVGGFVLIGAAGEATNEIAMITADDGDYDLTRGVLDTVPRTWPAGTPVWFVDESTVFEDTVVRAAAEVVDYKLLSRTSQGLLALAAADLESATLTERPWLPNRPADVTAYGEAFSAPTDLIDAIMRPDPWVTVTWAIRNRLDEDALILAWDDASQTAESGQTTTIEVRDTDGTLITTHDGLSGTSFDVPDASFGSAPIVELRVFSERTDADGDFVSLQYFSHWVQVGPITFDSDAITMDNALITMDND